VTYLFEKWDTRLGQLGEPFYADGMVVVLPARPVLLANFYRVLATSQIKVARALGGVVAFCNEVV